VDDINVSLEGFRVGFDPGVNGERGILHTAPPLLDLGVFPETGFQAVVGGVVAWEIRAAIHRWAIHFLVVVTTFQSLSTSHDHVKVTCMKPILGVQKRLTYSGLER
jgi:hypothetical protein